MTYDEKIAIVIIDDLPVWQKLNVAAFLTSSIAIKFPETHGRPFITASGTEYLPFIKHPLLIYKAADAAQIRKAFIRAKERGLHVGIYTQQLFATKNEEENLREIASVDEETLELVGIVIYGDDKKVDKAVKDLKYHG